MSNDKKAKINPDTNEVYCSNCESWTFSRLYAQFKRKPVQCPKCKRYYKW